MDGYARDKFDIWSTQPGGCTTRQAVLARDGKDVQDKSSSCQPESGSWYSAYEDTDVTEVAKATIDHMVPLAEAWRSFGNDLKDPQLLIASESSNTSKSDSGPADWKPTNHAFWCTYAADYTHIKSVRKLTTTDDEKRAVDVRDAALLVAAPAPAAATASRSPASRPERSIPTVHSPCPVRLSTDHVGHGLANDWAAAGG
ncbi:hypothetical protein [Streptomyces collinus]|uniref:hypothetical protein n=1 Tax=Streptomyces collinus TaxID=42684 RepID=UPI003687B443